jgi:hypothetical protein
MAHESFQDPEVAALLNAEFVAIKVDREERPDLDSVYMSVCQALTGAGGWPLTVFLTPETKPFYAGTYFPKTTGGGRPGLMELLALIARTWREQRDKALEAGEQIARALAPRAQAAGVGPDLVALEKAYYALDRAFDAKRGGFGGAPKFPTPHQLNFLLRWHRAHPESRAFAMVEKTLAAMRAGGIYDHIGLGFARYSVDERWLVPHFEKMLYDQALLAYAYLEAYQIGGRAEFASTAREIFAYVLRDMTHPQGGFYTAEDADSEGREGLFYVWTPGQVDAVLGPELGDLFRRFYDIGEAGNFEHGTSIPWVTRDVEVYARARGLEPERVRDDLARAREMLFAAREKRVHPLKDDKVVTALNGLMIAALAKGFQVLGDEALLQAARRGAGFVLAHLRDDQGRLLRRWREGQTSGPGFLDDHAFFIWGLLELHQAEQDPAWLETALELARAQERLFADELHGGYYFTAHDAETLIIREKDFYDGATPSGNSVAAMNLIRLARLTSDTAWQRRADKLLAAFAGSVREQPLGHTQFLCALDLALSPGRELVVAGDIADPRTQALLAVARRGFRPDLTLLLRPPGQAGERVAALAPFARDMTTLDGAPAAYLCVGKSCQRPVSDPAELEALLA